MGSTKAQAVPVATEGGREGSPAAGAARRFLPLLLLLVLAAAVHGRTVGHDFILLDDDSYLPNAVVRKGLTLPGVAWAFTAFHANNWHPLTWLSHMADVSLFGMDPAWHHGENVLLHGVNACLFFLFLRRATGCAGRSLFAAALFAVHPVHVESVAWVAERKDLLSGLLFFLALLAWERHGRAPSLPRYLAAAALFALGLTAKPMVVTLPFVLLLVDVWPLGRSSLAPPADGSPWNPLPAGRLLLEKVPLLLLSAASSAVTILAQGNALALAEVVPAGERAANALVSYVSYLGKFLLPTGLAVLYPLPSAIPAAAWVLSALFLLLATGLALAAARKAPFLPVGWLWFLGMLVPVIGIVQAGVQAMADRYAYLPFAGLYAIAAWGPWTLLPPRLRGGVPVRAAAGLAVALLGGAAFVQAGYWKDSEKLFLRTVSVTEGNYLVLNNLGVYYGMAGRPDLAFRYYLESVRARPSFPLGNVNVGREYCRMGRPDLARPYLELAVNLAPANPHAALYYGECLKGLGRGAEAAEWFRRARAIDPGSEEERRRVLAELGRLEGAGPP